ncbi:hypothetical protein HispidOSU_029976, partial [Sigmodon hispidus]
MDSVLKGFDGFWPTQPSIPKVTVAERALPPGLNHLSALPVNSRTTRRELTREGISALGLQRRALGG